MSDDIIDETATADEASHAEESNRARRRAAHREEHAAPRLWARARERSSRSREACTWSCSSSS